MRLILNAGVNRLNINAIGSNVQPHPVLQWQELDQLYHFTFSKPLTLPILQRMSPIYFCHRERVVRSYCVPGIRIRGRLRSPSTCAECASRADAWHPAAVHADGRLLPAKRAAAQQRRHLKCRTLHVWSERSICDRASGRTEGGGNFFRKDRTSSST